MSAVVWIADTINSILKVKYDDSSDKIAKIRKHLDDNDCDTSKADTLQSLLDDTVNKSLASVSGLTEKVTNVANCVTQVDPEIQKKVLSGIADTTNKILSGVPLDKIINQLDDILDDIDNKSCDDINDALDDPTDSTNDIASKVVKASVSVEVVASCDIKISQNLAKAAGLVSCVANALSNDTTGLAKHLETMNPSLKGVATNIQAGLKSGKNGESLLIEAKGKISANENSNNKYSDLADAVSGIF